MNTRVERLLSRGKARHTAWRPVMTKLVRSSEQPALVALKYNSDGWYDVHPLVAELPEFERALAPAE
jgi:hypothetical protein